MLLNQILSRENMLLALKRVEQNKGSHGVDMMPVQNLRLHIVENWRVEIPKPDGGVNKQLPRYYRRYMTLCSPNIVTGSGQIGVPMTQ